MNGRWASRDFLSGLLFSVAGGAFALGARHYPASGDGTLGPGFLPSVLGIVLALLGMLTCFRSMRATHPPIRPGLRDLRVLSCILGANVLFGLMLGGMPHVGLPPLGLVPSIFVLVLVAAMANRDFRWIETLVLAAFLALASRLLFIGLLDLPLRVWPTLTGG